MFRKRILWVSNQTQIHRVQSPCSTQSSLKPNQCLLNLKDKYNYIMEAVVEIRKFLRLENFMQVLDMIFLACDKMTLRYSNTIKHKEQSIIEGKKELANIFMQSDYACSYTSNSDTTHPTSNFLLFQIYFPMFPISNRFIIYHSPGETSEYCEMFSFPLSPQQTTSSCSFLS